MNPFRALVTAIATVLTALPFAALAQGSGAAGGVAGAATEDSVLLRWSLPEQLLVDGGFVISRTGGAGGSVIFQVPSPLPREEALASGLVTADEYDYLSSIFDPGLGGSSSEGDLAFARAIATLATVARPEFARVTGTLFEDDQVEAGRTYRYTVVTAAGRSIGTVEVVAGASVEPPGVNGLSAQVTGGAVALRWQRPSDETLIAAYNVYREHDGAQVRLTDNPHFIPVDDGANRPLYSDDGVVAGETYTYRVEGIDLFGRSAPLSAPVTVLVPDPRPLAVPQIADSTAGDLEITIEWTPVQDERVRALGVRRYTDPDGDFELLTPGLLPVSATSFIDTDVQGGVNYYYTLISVDGGGRISAESIMWAQTGFNPTPPSAPGAVRVLEGTDGLQLDWQAPPESDVASYRIYASRDPGATESELRFVELTSATSYELAMLEGNLVQLQLAVSAVNSSDVEGPRSQVVSGRMIDKVPPPAPRLVAVESGQSELAVRWAHTSDPDVHMLRLFRAAGEGPLELLQGSLDPHRGLFRDGDVEAGAEYTYILEAVDASGNVSERSASLSGRAYDVTVPARVQGVTIKGLEEGVGLEWPTLPEVRYVVERSRDGGASFVELTEPQESSSFTDIRGRPGDSYRVFAVSPAGRLGEPSAVVTVP